MVSVLLERILQIWEETFDSCEGASKMYTKDLKEKIFEHISKLNQFDLDTPQGKNQRYQARIDLNALRQKDKEAYKECVKVYYGYLKTR